MLELGPVPVDCRAQVERGDDDPLVTDKQIERACVASLLRAVREGDVRASMFVLRSRWPSRWGA